MLTIVSLCWPHAVPARALRTLMRGAGLGDEVRIVLGEGEVGSSVTTSIEGDGSVGGECYLE